MKKLFLIVLLMCICVYGIVSASTDFDGPYFNSVEFESWEKTLPPWDSSNWIVVDGKSRPYKLEDKIIFITSLDFSVVSGYCDKVRVLFYSGGNLRDKKNILKIGNKDSIPEPQFAIVALPSKWTDYVSICAYQIKNRESILFDTWLVPLKEIATIVPRRIFEKALISMCELEAMPEEYNLPVHSLDLKVVDKKHFYIAIIFG